MRFWDTSALVPLLVEDPTTSRVRSLLREDPDVVAWWATSVECASALARLRREEILTAHQEERSLDLLQALRASWTEVIPSTDVRDHAARLLRVHPLPAADAVQLAAAQVWARSPGYAELVTFDERLAMAGRLEGFRIRGLDDG